VFGFEARRAFGNIAPMPDCLCQKPPAVLVVGSCNYDLTIQSERLPGPSETVLGGDYRAAPGGKGANQALGLARLGTDVRFLSRVGKDHYGELILAHLGAQAGLDISQLEMDEEAPTGLALITLDSAGTRTIVVAPGANAALSEARVERFLRDASSGAILVTGLEIPVPTICHLMRLAKRRNLRTVLHASPAVEIPRDLLRLVDVLVLNQSELHVISGRSAQHLETAAGAAERLLAEGVGTVLVTMGTRGVLCIRQAEAWPPLGATGAPRFIPGYKVRVKDGNVASSAFIAGFVHRLACSAACVPSGAELGEAVRYGLAAMAVSLGRPGGQASLASCADVAAFLAQGGSRPEGTVEGAPRARAGASLESDQDPELADDKLVELGRRATSIRRRIIRMLYTARSGHPGGSLSVVEVLTALYFHTMVYNPRQPDWPNRDRLVLSKGHAAPALYATLIEAGFLDPALEGTLRKLGSPLQGHPDRRKCPGVEMSTGSLGQGLSVANGMALAARHTHGGYRVYCIMGDGEVQEGQIWEAAMTAAHNELDNLCAVVDYNALQIDGNISQIKSPIEPLADKWKAFGWNVINVDGHDLVDLCAAFDRARRSARRPTMLVAHTIKGHGVSFMEGVIEYHGSTLSEDEVRRALSELEGGGLE
jgi:transketolase